MSDDNECTLCGDCGEIETDNIRNERVTVPCPECIHREIEAGLYDRPQPEQYEIGIYGKAYDGPGKHRAYTHKEQPDNFGAGRLGEAARAAHPGGDLIDYGLSLLRQLQEHGFGVFEIGRPEPPQGEPK